MGPRQGHSMSPILYEMYLQRALMHEINAGRKGNRKVQYGNLTDGLGISSWRNNVL